MPDNIIVNNHIYDYVRLKKIVYNITSKNNLVSSLFKVKYNILYFDKLKPCEVYLYNSLFNFISNVSIKFIDAFSLFDSDTVIVSGKVPYYRGKWFNKKQGDFTLVGAGFKSIMEKYVNCKFYVYENSETILYEKI